MQIDAHQHFWRLDRGEYTWLKPSLAPLYRDYLPDELAPHLADAGVSATILVQAAASEDETRFLLEIAKATPFVAGVVGWVDMEAPDVVERLSALKKVGGGYLKGVRPMLQDIADPQWVLSPSLDRAFDAIEALELRFDALVRPIHLQPLLTRLEQRPDLKVVIDHAAKPPIGAGTNGDWSTQLAAIASHTSAKCKLSGLVTEARWDWRARDLAPFVEHIIETFGAERVMWGSDWPVLNLATDYRTWHTTAKQLIAGLPARERAMIFGGTAASFYGIETRGTVR
jgi:L-fuconolactonase